MYIVNVSYYVKFVRFLSRFAMAWDKGHSLHPGLVLYLLSHLSKNFRTRSTVSDLDPDVCLLFLGLLLRGEQSSDLSSLGNPGVVVSLVEALCSSSLRKVFKNYTTIYSIILTLRQPSPKRQGC